MHNKILHPLAKSSIAQLQKYPLLWLAYNLLPASFLTPGCCKEKKISGWFLFHPVCSKLLVVTDLNHPYPSSTLCQAEESSPTLRGSFCTELFYTSDHLCCPSRHISKSGILIWRWVKSWAQNCGVQNAGESQTVTISDVHHNQALS